MTELTCWPLDNKQYTAVALGAAYAARSRGLLTAESFSLTTNGDNTVTLAKGLGCLHVSDFWACFPYALAETLVQFEDADGVYPRKDVVVLGYDKNANQAGLYVRTGLAAASPVMPTIRRDNDYDEIYLYCVNRPTGATSITADNVEDLRLDTTYCGLMRDTIDAIDTSVMQASFEAFLAQIEQELDQLNAGTATMLKSTYDPQGKSKDIFKTIDAAAAKYEATLPYSGWVASTTGEQQQGYLYAQEATLTALTPGAPTVTDASEFLSGPGFEPTGYAETDEALAEALNIINAGVTSTLSSGRVRVLVKEVPTSDISVNWTIRTEVS